MNISRIIKLIIIPLSILSIILGIYNTVLNYSVIAGGIVGIIIVSVGLTRDSLDLVKIIIERIHPNPIQNTHFLLMKEENIIGY